jgi:hypothetical protein
MPSIAPIDEKRVGRPVGGRCPGSYPIKGLARGAARLYYAPGGDAYDEARPEVCFATARSAEAAGYKPAQAPRERGGQD